MDVAGILAPRQQGPDDRQGIARGQSPRRAGELAADLDVGLDRGTTGQRRRDAEGETCDASQTSRAVQSRT